MRRPPALLVISDRHAAARAGHGLIDAVKAALEGGAPALLLRDKDLDVDRRRALGEELRVLVRAAGSQLLVSSDVALARHLEADGVHLAANDAPLTSADGRTASDARRIGANLLIGRSCHNAAEISAARRESVTYATVSPVAASTSKPGYGPALGTAGFAALLPAAAPVPLLALGGVTAANAASWRCAGAHGIAVMGAVMGADDPAAAVRHLLESWGAASPAERSADDPQDISPMHPTGEERR